MSREFIGQVLERIAKVTTVLVETSKIKEKLDNCDDDKILNEILELTKEQVEKLHEHSSAVKDYFLKLNDLEKESTDVNANTSDPSEHSVDSETVNKESESQPKKPLIKLVDIQKLVEPKSLVKSESPKQTKRIHFDDTVVIITSSDEDSSKIRTTALKSSNERKATTRKINISQNNSSSDSETETLPKKMNQVKNGRRRKSKLLENVKLLDTSTSSDSSFDEQLKTNKPKKTKKSKMIDVNETPDWEKDPKFKSNCYVKLYRISSEKLKEYYSEKMELLNINNLTNMSSLERKRKKFTDTSEDEGFKTNDNSKSLSKKDSENNEVMVNENNPEEKEYCEDKESEKQSLEDKQDSDLTSIGLSLSPVRDSVTPNDMYKQLAEHAMDLLNSDKEDQDDTLDNEDSLTKQLDKKENEDKKSESSENVPEKESEKPHENDENKEENSAEKQNGNETEEDGKDKVENQKLDEDNKEKDSSVEDNDKTEKSEENQDEMQEKKSWKKSRLLTAPLCSDNSSSSSDSEKAEKKTSKGDNMEEHVTSDDEPKLPMAKKKRLVKKRMKNQILSDSESEEKDSNCDENSQKESSSSSESEKEATKEEEEEEAEKPKHRKRIKRINDSSDDDENKSTRKQIRHIIDKDSLAETTKQAEAEEKERKARIAEKQKKYNQIYELGFEQNAKVEKIVLDFDDKNNKELLKVDDRLVAKLKPHQASGVQFMWDACFESVERAKTTKGSGCILAHCMGLGKTLQIITLCHTLLVNSEQTNVKKVLVVSPLNTVLNWVNEFKQWLPENEDFDVFELVSSKQNYERLYQVKTWHTHGGVLIIGYDMFRNLSNPENKRLSKKMRSSFQEGLVDPGPDLVVCDEGHLLKNEKTNLSIAMNRIKTLRRIVLTGTPLQNNLKEYFCMVQFIKPNLLGTYKEYLNRFVNPITNGQYTDSTPHDIQIMRKRSHVLHKMLDGVVQRRDYSVLEPYLPPKFEFVLFLKLTETQIKLYQHYMDHFARRSSDGSNRTSFLFMDFQALQRICTHPRVLLDKSNEMKLIREKQESDSEGSLRDFIDDDDEDAETTPSSNSSSGDERSTNKPARKRVTRATAALAKEDGDADSDVVLEEPEEKEWWQEYCDGQELDVISHSTKLFLLFEILKECEQIGDKVLVFSQSLYSLNVIEYFLAKINDATQAGDTSSVDGFSGSWCLGLDYFRLDGSSSCDNRNIWCNIFNDPANTRARLFLISTKAGGLGINLVAANRVIIFDVSWNPSHDIQSIYRVYRFGQTKPCYIYRFVTLGTMEMKVYERQVTKQAISKRVIDEQQIDRHYNQNDLAELYRFEPDPGERPIPLVPKDVLLGELLQKFEQRIYKYHEHQSLLENKEEEGLNEEERKAAWEEFENEKKQRNTWGTNYNPLNFTDLTSMNITDLALMNLVRKRNPTWSTDQLRLLVPSLRAQLQDQMSRGDLSLYQKLQPEIQSIQLQNQKLTAQLYQQQLFEQMQRNPQLFQQLANMNFTNRMNQFPNQMPGTSRTSATVTEASPSDIIDLND